jgi:glycine betaine/proline transport system substrate-binding protein
MLAFYEDESDGDMELTAKEFLKTQAMWKSWASNYAADISSWPLDQHELRRSKLDDQ